MWPLLSFSQHGIGDGATMFETGETSRKSNDRNGLAKVEEAGDGRRV